MGRYIALAVLIVEVLVFLAGISYIVVAAVKRGRKRRADERKALETAVLEEKAREDRRRKREEQERAAEELDRWSTGDIYDDDDPSYIEAQDKPLAWDDPVPDEAELWTKEDDRYTT